MAVVSVNIFMDISNFTFTTTDCRSYGTVSNLSLFFAATLRVSLGCTGDLTGCCAFDLAEDNATLKEELGTLQDQVENLTKSEFM